MKIKQKTIRMGFVLSLFLAVCGGCGKEAGQFDGKGQDRAEAAGAGAAVEAADAGEAVEAGTESLGTEEPQESLGADQFVILDNEMSEEYLALRQLDSGKEYAYHYSLATRFLDKYGNRAAVSCFVPGRVISVREEDHQGNVLEVQISDKAWEYDGVTRYSFEEDRQILKIGGERYSYDENLFIYADGEVETLSDLSDMDTIRLVGMGKHLISVAVTAGHGELALKNTELFEGSFIQVGSRIFAEITPDMTIELPEGVHTVTVANDGYGGSADVTIADGERTELDLDGLKGEGPKVGEILFAVDVEGAILQMDGEEMDYSEPIPLRYGVHTLTVSAEGYETYSKKLFVNSKEATIVIELAGGMEDAGETGDPSEAVEATEADSEAGHPQPGSLAGSLAGSHTSAGAPSGTLSGAGAGTETDAAVQETDGALENSGSAGTGTDGSSPDYLSTLSELLSLLTGED